MRPNGLQNPVSECCRMPLAGAPEDGTLAQMLAKIAVRATSASAFRL